MGAKKLKEEAVGYFEELPKGTQNIVRELVVDIMKQKSDGYPSAYADKDGVSLLECQSRDGFMPFDSNRGGIEIKHYTDLQYYHGGGSRPAHKGAAEEIERQIDYSIEMTNDSALAEFPELMAKHGITKIDHCYAQDLAEKNSEFEAVVDFIENAETENMSGDSSSITLETRFMYHGKTSKGHSASVSCAINTEGPYHRSSISWAPGVFCEGAKEVTITWSTQAELKKKLKATLAQLAKAIF